MPDGLPTDWPFLYMHAYSYLFRRLSNPHPHLATYYVPTTPTQEPINCLVNMTITQQIFVPLFCLNRDHTTHSQWSKTLDFTYLMYSMFSHSKVRSKGYSATYGLISPLVYEAYNKSVLFLCACVSWIFTLCERIYINSESHTVSSSLGFTFWAVKQGNWKLFKCTNHCTHV